ncbi:uncharacterized protein LOC110264789 [Arachis ipaensis]|uniref:uncharacterized protein LOC110264789 n=1 Tax=Arachis ipaensis TaxID=130454 RepID=UPI000A2B9486|nr:uncharacterized protein LOC110264789 [Arachis ipaensis]
MQSPTTANPQALLSLPSALSNTTWYPDSGASHHITFDQRNLATGSDYEGIEKVYGETGHGMKIEHIGSSFMHAFLSNRPFTLRNLLHVPTISKNLVSIAKFALDNCVFFEFWHYFCNIKCQMSKKILFQGLLKEGLYRFEVIQVIPRATETKPLHSPPITPTCCRAKFTNPSYPKSHRHQAFTFSTLYTNLLQAAKPNSPTSAEVTPHTVASSNSTTDSPPNFPL